MFDKLKASLGLNKSELRAQAEAAAQAEVKRKQQEKAEKAQKRADAKAKKLAAEAEVAKAKPLSEKEKATLAGEPYISVISVDIDPDNPGNGAFEMDWNDVFVARLIKAGYPGKTDQDIVDNWFKTLCRNVIAETYEQSQADPEVRASNRRDLGNGRTEVS